MTYNEAVQIVDSISYRPGVFFSLIRTIDADAVQLKLSRTAYDADAWESPPRDQLIDIITSTLLDYEFLKRMSPDDFKGYVYAELFRFEVHEIDEWLRFDGVQFKDPHPEIKRSSA